MSEVYTFWFYKLWNLVSGIYISEVNSFISEEYLVYFSIYPITNKKILLIIERLKPVDCLEVFDNFYNDRRKLYKKYNGDKKGRIYVIVNKFNGKLYVGSTKYLDCSNRLKNYFNLAHIVAQKNRPIHNAILKYGLVNFAFIIVEEVDMNIHNVEDRETYWILRLKPEYNATKFGARNVGTECTDEMKLIISKKRSSGSIYIYNEFKQLLAIAPSLTSIASLLGNKSITIALKRAIETSSLFRGSWYFSRVPILNERLDASHENPLMDVTSYPPNWGG